MLFFLDKPIIKGSIMTFYVYIYAITTRIQQLIEYSFNL